MLRRFLALLLLIPALAGCLADDDMPDDPIPNNGSNVGLNDGFVSPFRLAGEDGHNHSDASHHDIAWQITQEAFLDLGPDGGVGAPGGISEMHVAGDYIFQGVMGYGFQIIDISNPLEPVLVSSYDMSEDGTDDDAQPAADANPLIGLPFEFYLADIKSDEAGDWLYVALEASSNPGVFIYDVRDKANPVFSGFYPNPGAPPGAILGCHMIEYAIIMDQEYLFCAPLDDSVYVGLIQPPNDSGVREIQTVTRWQPAGAEDSPEQAESVQADPTGAGEYSLLGGHQDMTWQKDPLTGADVLSVSLWDLGWYWVDVSVPAAPQTLGFYRGADSPDYDGQMHTAMLYGTDDGRRIAVGIPEVANPPVMHVLDATDYANPQVLAHWNGRDSWVNDDGVSEAGRFSTHNFQIVDEKVYMTHYHAGTLVLDLADPANPELTGVFTPMDRRADTYGAGYGGSWDVLVSKGYMYTANAAGLFVLHHNGDPLTDEHTGFA